METLQYAKKVKANKDHKCSYCNMTINRKTIYEKSSHKHEGYLYTWKSHTHCQEIVSKLNMFEDCDEGVTGEDFDEYIRMAFYNLCLSVEHTGFEYQLKCVLIKNNITYNP